MAEGWVAIHRQLNNNWLWKDKPFSKGQAWIDILLRVNHEKAKVLIGNQIVDIKQGQTVWSVKGMADKWGWSRKKVDSFLTLLGNDQMLTKESTTKYTLLTVEEWALYQPKEQQKNIKRTSTEHQKNTNNNDNNDNNKKSCSFTPPTLEEEPPIKKPTKEDLINNFFEKTWAMYHNKKGKASVSKEAKKEIFKLGDEFERCIERYNKEQAGTEIKFSKHGSTFFNGGYDDFLDKKYKTQNTKKEPVILEWVRTDA